MVARGARGRRNFGHQSGDGGLAAEAAAGLRYFYSQNSILPGRPTGIYFVSPDE